MSLSSHFYLTQELSASLGKADTLWTQHKPYIVLGAVTNYWVVTSAEKSKEEDRPPELSTVFVLL